MDGFSSSMVTEQALEGIKALSSLLEFQPGMLLEALELMEDLHHTICALDPGDPCLFWLVPYGE